MEQARVILFRRADPVAVPRLIEPGVFDAVQASLKRYVTFVPRNQQRFYLLKGLLFSECGRRMHGTAWHENRYYCCEGKKTKECRWPSQKADPLEIIVTVRPSNPSCTRMPWPPWLGSSGGGDQRV